MTMMSEKKLDGVCFQAIVEDQSLLTELVEAAREANRLRARCSDLELMFRAEHRGIRIVRHLKTATSEARWVISCDLGIKGGYRNEKGRALGWDWWIELQDDGTGLPILTPEFRSLLRERHGDTATAAREERT